MTTSFRVLVRVTHPGTLSGVQAGDRLYFVGGLIERDSPMELHAELISAAWPLVEERLPAFAAGDATPATGETPSGAAFVVLPAEVRDDDVPQKTRRFEKQALETAQGANALVPFLSRLPPALVQSLRRASTLLDCSPGDVLIEEGTEAGSLYMVEDGEVEVVLSGETEEAVIAILGEGEVLGEMSILTGEPTSATVRARSHCKVMALEKEALEEMLMSNPLLSREFSRLLAARMRAALNIREELDRSLYGSLHMVDPADLIQTMNASRRTGTLTLNSAQGEGKVFFEEGRLRGATFGAHEGEDALYELLQWRDGKFNFERDDLAVQGEIEGDTMGILMNTMRLIDEAGREE